MVELTIPSMEQIKTLDIFKKYGTKTQISDFAILLGGFVNDNYHSSEGNTLKNRTGYYWTRTNNRDNHVRVVDSDGNGHCDIIYNRSCGCHPTLSYSSISSIISNKVRERDELLEVEYGEYPQKVTSEDLQKILENKYINNKLNKTNKTYTTDSRKYDEYDKDFKAQEHIEYEDNGKKYVRVNTNRYDGETLSNDISYKNNDYVWVEVLPIKWLVDEKKDIAITKDIIFAGVQFNYVKIYKGDFESTDLYWFLNNILIKDIMPNKNIYDYEEIVRIKRENVKKAMQEYNEALKEYLKANDEEFIKKTFTKKKNN